RYFATENCEDQQQSRGRKGNMKRSATKMLLFFLVLTAFLVSTAYADDVTLTINVYDPTLGTTTTIYANTDLNVAGNDFQQATFSDTLANGSALYSTVTMTLVGNGADNTDMVIYTDSGCNSTGGGTCSGATMTITLTDNGLTAP